MLHHFVAPEKEWQKSYREVELAQHYPKAQKAQEQVQAFKQLIKDEKWTVEKLKLSDAAERAWRTHKANVTTQQSPESPNLDYADLYFLWRSEALDGNLMVGDKTLKQVCDELEACRQEVRSEALPSIV